MLGEDKVRGRESKKKRKQMNQKIKKKGMGTGQREARERKARRDTKLLATDRQTEGRNGESCVQQKATGCVQDGACKKQAERTCVRARVFVFVCLCE